MYFVSSSIQNVSLVSVNDSDSLASVITGGQCLVELYYIVI